MKFNIVVQELHTDKPSWVEPYDKPAVTTQAEAEVWGIACVQYFNDTRRVPANEPERDFVSAEITGPGEEDDDDQD